LERKTPDDRIRKLPIHRESREPLIKPPIFVY